MTDSTIEPTYCIYHMSIDWENDLPKPVERWVLSTRRVSEAIGAYYRQPSGQGRIGIHLSDGTHHWLTHKEIHRLCDHLHSHNQYLIKELNRHVKPNTHLRRR